MKKMNDASWIASPARVIWQDKRQCTLPQRFGTASSYLGSDPLRAFRLGGRKSAAGRLERKGNHVAPDEELGDLGGRKEEAMNGFVSHCECEPGEKHVCKGRGAVNEKLGRRCGELDHPRLTVHREEGARRQQYKHVLDDVQAKRSVVGAVDQAEQESKCHACRASSVSARFRPQRAVAQGV